MRYFKLTIAYDGTDFHGWQIQAEKPTIQGEIVNVLRRLTQEHMYVGSEEVGPDVDARWSARGKIYRYRIYRGKVVPPMIWRYVLHYPFPLDEEAMRDAAARFAGTHDFASFAASTGSEEDDKERSTEREIFSTELTRTAENEELVFTVRGRSFLRYMVRKMVGTLLDVGRGRLKPDDIDRLFELRDRSKSGPTVPPQGLVMVEVQHEEAWRLGRP
jgi:tRNA pseudouridine38-40 synthase